MGSAVRLVAYIALMAATFAAAGEMRSELAAFAAGAEAVLLALCAVQAWWLRRGVALRLELAERVPAGGAAQGVLAVENRAPFPVFHGDVALTVRNLWGSVICSGRERFAVAGGLRTPGRTRVPFTVGAVYCAGPLAVSAGPVAVRDMLGLFCVRAGEGARAELFVMPAGGSVELAGLLDATEQEASAPAPAGEAVPPELDEVRAYRPGDSLRSVHWKLSARRDELLIRVFAREGQRTAVLEVDCGTLADHDALRLSAVLEATAAVLGSLDAAGVPCPAWVRVRGGASAAARTRFIEGGEGALPVPDRLEQVERFLGGEARGMREAAAVSGTQKRRRLFSRGAGGAADPSVATSPSAAAKTGSEGMRARDAAAFASSDADAGSERAVPVPAGEDHVVIAAQEAAGTSMGNAANAVRLAISATALLSVNGEPVAQFSPHGWDEAAAAKERAPWR